MCSNRKDALHPLKNFATHQRLLRYMPWSVRKIKGMGSFKEQYWKSIESAEAYTVSSVLFIQSGLCSNPVRRTTQAFMERDSRSDLK